MNSGYISGLVLSLPEAHLITESDAMGLLQEAQKTQRNISSLVVEKQLLSSNELARFCEQEYNLPLIDLDQYNLKEIPTRFLSEDLIESYHVLPVYLEGHTLYIAMSDPTNVAALEGFGFNFGLHTEALLVDEIKLDHAIKAVLANHLEIKGVTDEPEFELVSEDNNLVIQGVTDETLTEDDAPIVRYINKMLLDAINRGASDLHFEPYEQKYRIRFRIDGLLHEIAHPPAHFAPRFAARLKVMSRLDISERRLPQDGRIKMTLKRNRSVDLRVSTLPTLWGEKIVLRILDSSIDKLNIESLGLTPKQLDLYQKALQTPQGMILVTGPTGSGKTVTLYSGLHILNTEQRNIATAEDPIEINLSGINQVQIHPKAGLTFAQALRSFLRQDPDVVMVGEIRDLETAEIAIKAAQTGHLVLSTLHTNSAPESLTRLSNMGVPSYNIASSVSLIIAQRLLRKLCPDCKQQTHFNNDELAAIGFSDHQLASGISLYRAAGCPNCSNGYKGRIGIYEILAMTPQLASIIMQGANSIELAEHARLEGMQCLYESALEKARLGITTIDEVQRVTHWKQRKTPLNRSTHSSRVFSLSEYTFVDADTPQQGANS